MNKLWKIVRVLLFAVFLSIIAGAIFAILYGDEITKIFLKEINNHLEAKIEVGDMKFSMLKKFPAAALEFKNITVYTPTNFTKKENSRFSNDTVLIAENFFLQFSLTDLFKKNYIIKTIHIKNGNIHIEISDNGEKNFIVWKTTSDTVTSKVKLQLKDIRFTNMEARYFNRMNHSDFEFFLNRLNMRGELSKNSGRLEIRSDLLIRNLSIKKTSYLKNTNAVTSFKLQAVNGNYDISKGKINVSDLDFRIAGQFQTRPEKKMNLNIIGENLDISKLINILPDKISNSINNYQGKGALNINSTLSGRYGPGIIPHIESDFFITDGEIKEKTIDYYLKIKKVSGSITNGSDNKWLTTNLDINHYEVNIGESILNGRCVLTGFPNPIIDFQASGEIDFAKFIGFFDIKNFEKGSGTIYADINLSGKLVGNRKQGWKFLRNLDPRGYLEFDNVALKTKGSYFEFNNVNGRLKFSDKVLLDRIKMNIGNDEIEIDGKIGNVLSQISGKDKPLVLEATIRAEHFNPSVFLDSLRKKDSVNHGSNPYIFPENFYMDIKLDIGLLNYKRFTANTFNGNLLYKPGMLNLNSLTFKSMKGNFSGSIVVFQDINGQFLTRTQSNLENINIKELFYSFNNFGQKFITDKHINGMLTGEISFSSQWTNNLQIIKKNILAESSVKITDGELIEFEPMLGLARYINVSELKHIHFSELINRIIIRDEIITIPQMDIHSSAFNISLSGTHHFDNHFSYKTKVLLSEVLAGKTKRIKPGIEEFGEIKDDGFGKTSLYLSIDGNTDDYKVSYDTKTAMLEVKKNLNNEKKELKKILNQELGLFRKDTSNYSSDNLSNKNKFKIIWDESQRDSSKIDTIPKSSFRILWEENDTSEIK
ncbi:MAG: hypothetical protein IMY71_15665 [Bacteroidetes bacterium]|nr:hypothetical protein [Bacteroidota bacterium]